MQLYRAGLMQFDLIIALERFLHAPQNVLAIHALFLSLRSSILPV